MNPTEVPNRLGPILRSKALPKQPEIGGASLQEANAHVLQSSIESCTVLSQCLLTQMPKRPNKEYHVSGRCDPQKWLPKECLGLFGMGLTHSKVPSRAKINKKYAQKLPGSW